MSLDHHYLTKAMRCLSPLLLFMLLAIDLNSGVSAMRQQAVGAKGRLFCGGKPASNILVKLFDKDTGG